jgi:hypothetical protein
MQTSLKLPPGSTLNIEHATTNALLKVHLLKKQVGNEAPEPRILKLEFTDPPRLLDRRSAHLRPTRLRWYRKVRWFSSLSPPMICHNADAESFGDVSVKFPPSNQRVRLVKLGRNFCNSVSLRFH